MADPATASAPSETPAAAPKLDDLMLAMDVVDTLRHQEALVEKELGQEDRDAALKKRLRDIYESQGLAVDDRILDEGLKALKESRFVYTPPPGGFNLFLARMWVGRRVVGPLLGIVFLVIVAIVGWQIWKAGEASRLAEEIRIEITETLPKALAAAGDATLAAAVDPEAKARAEALIVAGRAALTANDPDGARRAIAALDALRGALNQTYELRIVARPGEDTGIYRIPDINEGARNYYIIVEAVTDSGEVLSMPVVNQEDGKTETVTKWGVRVPEATYNAVRDDKLDDGIVQDNILGVKKRGTLGVAYLMPVEAGAITRWD